MKKINLGKLKYIIPTIAMPFVMSGCIKQIPKSGVIVAKNDSTKSLYIDTNGDKLVDFKMQFGSAPNSLYYDYALPGDSIMFKVVSEHNKTIFVGNGGVTEFLDSINGRDYIELCRLQQLNEIRVEAGQQKVR